MLVDVSNLINPHTKLGAPTPPPPTTPITVLGASCLGWWHCDNASLITQVAGAVSSWKDVVAGYDAAQATGASQAIYSATSWNGAAPGITFDGTDDFFTLASQPFPALALTASIFVVVDQTCLVADTATRCIASYGDNAGATQRRLSRRVITGANVVTAQSSSSLSDATGDFSGRHYIRALYTPTFTFAGLDGTMSAGVAVVPATGTTRFRIGATVSDIVAAFFKGVIREVVVTGALSAQQVTDINAYLASRV